MTPDEYTNKEFFIEVDNGHKLYVYDWGNPKGLPVIYLHGGPGDKAKYRHKAPFDPQRHHVVFFDQRGGGQSLPSGSLEHNITADLIEDISKIADQMKFKQFVLSGGSWGTTLALAYALKYPKRVKAMVLSAIFTASRREIEWINNGQCQSHFPEVWMKYLASTPKEHHANPTAYHYKNILGDNEQLVLSSALAVSEMEHCVMTLDDRVPPTDPTTFDPTSMRIYVHYMSNNCFLPDRYILDNAHKLKMPIWLVHGRYDMSCPPITAYELDQALPNSHLIWATSNHKNEHENVSILSAILLQLAEKG